MKYCFQLSQLEKFGPIASSFVAFNECPKEPLEVTNMNIIHISRRKSSPWLNQLFRNVSLITHSPGEGISLKNTYDEIRNEMTGETRNKLDGYERSNHLVIKEQKRG